MKKGSGMRSKWRELTLHRHPERQVCLEGEEAPLFSQEGAGRLKVMERNLSGLEEGEQCRSKIKVKLGV